MKGPVEPVHRSVPETIQEVIELTGFLCFLFRSTPTPAPDQDEGKSHHMCGGAGGTSLPSTQVKHK